MSGSSVVKYQEWRQFTPHDPETPQTKYTNVYYHCKPEFVWLRNPYCHPEELQIEDVLNTKTYWQHLELSQIEDTVHCKKKKHAMHTKYGVLRLSRLEHLIWREVTPNFWCVFYAKLGVLSHQLSVLSH